MTTTTLTLAAFLEARLAEDEAAARATIEADYSEGRWSWSLHGLPYRTALVNERGAVLLPAKNDDVYPSRFVADHIARHDPARVLAEVASKREIMRRARRERGRYEQTGGNLGNPIEATIAYEMAVRVLAAVYSDHPDYDESWRP